MARNENAQLIIDLVEDNPGRLTIDEVVGMFDANMERGIRISIGQLLRWGTIAERNGRLFPIAADEPHEVIQSGGGLLAYVHEEEIEVPANASHRKIEVVFELQLRVKSARRIGLADRTEKRAIVWLPPGSTVLRVQMGDYMVSQQAELMQGNYLCIVVPANGAHYVRYYAPPANERFALLWEESA